MYKYVSNELKGDYDIGMYSIKYNGRIYPHLPQELKNNKEITLEAIKSYPYCFQYIPNELKHDEDVCIEIVKRNGELLEYLPLKDNSKVVYEAVKNNEKAIYFTTIDVLEKYGKTPKKLITNLEKELGIETLK